MITANAIKPELRGVSASLIEEWCECDLGSVTENEIKSTLETMGNGASAVCVVAWTGGGGHAYNAVNIDGVIHHVDSQQQKINVWDSPYGDDGGSYYAVFFDADGSYVG